MRRTGRFGLAWGLVVVLAAVSFWGLVGSCVVLVEGVEQQSMRIVGDGMMIGGVSLLLMLISIGLYDDMHMRTGRMFHIWWNMLTYSSLGVLAAGGVIKITAG